MIILVDMDDVLADFEGEFLERWKKLHPDKLCIPFEERKAFHLEKEYPEELREIVKSIYYTPGFCRSLKPIYTSLEAISDMKKDGHDVFICTAPLSHYESCVLEKYEWTERYLGIEWTKRIILTRDKTLVKGDFLIDDKPEITGIITPVWEHIIYDKPYNRSVTSKKRLTDLRDWKSVLFPKQIAYLTDIEGHGSMEGFCDEGMPPKQKSDGS